jgi:hypothetical protein
MKLIQWLAFFFILGILIIRGIWPEDFSIDKFSIALLFLLAIPLIAPYLKKAKWFGAEFIFKDEIKRLDNTVQKAEQKAEKTQSLPIPFETFAIKNASDLLDIDPTLSLAALRIEIEKVLSATANKLVDTNKDLKRGNRFYISQLLKSELISPEQGKALHSIVDICNEAIHGAKVTKEEAKEIIEIAKRLNHSFAVGYSINTNKNDNYSKHGLICEWEHCVEHFPLLEVRTELSCPVFGHNCPGGIESRKQCNKNIEDIPKKRFIKGDK